MMCNLLKSFKYKPVKSTIATFMQTYFHLIMDSCRILKCHWESLPSRVRVTKAFYVYLFPPNKEAPTRDKSKIYQSRSGALEDLIINSLAALNKWCHCD